jgi:hypothetical protein
VPADRRRRVVLHIGAPKTGTTYLQAMLWANRRTLLEQDVFLPGRDQSDHFAFGQDVLEAGPDRLNERPIWRGAAERTMRAIERDDAPISVISDERLAAASSAQARRVLERLAGFEVHVVYGLRDLPRLLSSEWQQSVKHGLGRTFPDWIDDIRERRPDDWFWRVHDVGAVLSRWAPGDRACVHVVTLPGPGADDGELWRRFARAVGFDPTRTSPVERSNPSLGLLESTLVGRVQARLPAVDLRYHHERIVRGFIVDDVLAGRPDPLPILVPETHRDWLVTETIVRIEAACRAGFDLVGDPADLTDLDRGLGTTTATGHEPEMLDAAVDVIAHLVAVQAHERTQLDVLRGRFKPLDLLMELRRRALRRGRQIRDGLDRLGRRRRKDGRT